MEKFLAFLIATIASFIPGYFNLGIGIELFLSFFIYIIVYYYVMKILK